MKLIATAFICVILLTLLSACGGASDPSPTAVPPAADETAVRMAMATEVVATITAEAALVTTEPLPIDTATASPLSTDTPTVASTNTPKPTSTDTPTRKPTNTPTTTPTSTPPPGIGDTVQCGGMWQIKAIAPPDFSGIVTDEVPKGAYAKVYFMLTNLQDETASLGFGSLRMVGDLDGRTLRFDATYLGTNLIEKNQGIVPWFDDFPPLVEVKTSAVFDVNPSATSWSLLLESSGGLFSGCTAEIALYNTSVSPAVATDLGAANASGIIARVARDSINLRKGPGTNYGVAGTAVQGQSMAVVGRNAAADWLEVCCANDATVWVATSIVDIQGDPGDAPLSENIPEPPPPPTPKPAPTLLPFDTGIGSPEVRVGNWGIRLYDVKKAKTVYFFSNGDVAHGTWLIPFIETRNHGSGTDSPNYNLDFYLQDANGRTFTFNEFNDAVLGAAWQFQAGHLYDDINPGIMIGITLPVDVPQDLGDVWLRVKQDPTLAIYLGNASQLPSEN